MSLAVDFVPRPLMREKCLPLTDAQREIWFASQMSEGASLAYQEAMTLRLKGASDIPALRRALRQLVALSAALGESFLIEEIKTAAAAPDAAAACDGFVFAKERP